MIIGKPKQEVIKMGKANDNSHKSCAFILEKAENFLLQILLIKIQAFGSQGKERLLKGVSMKAGEEKRDDGQTN